MNTRLVLFLLLVILGGCAGKPDFQRPSMLPALHKKTQVFFTIETAPLVISPWDIRYQNIALEKDPRLQNYLRLFEQELSKLPTSLLQLSALDTVAFVRELAVAEQSRAAVPDYIHEVLYYDVYTSGDAYLRHVIHHEFYHMLEQQIYGSAYYKDPLWHALNADSFSYGNGGASARDPDVSVFSHPHPGFINGYAMSGLEEDKAEIWAIIWTSQSWEKAEPLIRNDKVLQDKIRLLTRQLLCLVPELENTWPEYVRPYLSKQHSCADLVAANASLATPDNHTSAADSQ